MLKVVFAFSYFHLWALHVCDLITQPKEQVFMKRWGNDSCDKKLVHPREQDELEGEINKSDGTTEGGKAE